MTWRAVLAVILAAFLLATGSAFLRGEPPAATVRVIDADVERWQAMPAELLLNVIESKMEEIGSLKGRIRQLEAELERVREIQRMKMAEARPPTKE